MSTDADFSRTFRSRLNAWRAELAQIELKAANADARARLECYAEIKTLQERRNRMSSCLDELDSTVDPVARERLREDLETLEEEFEESLEDCRDLLSRVRA